MTAEKKRTQQTRTSPASKAEASQALDKLLNQNTPRDEAEAKAPAQPPTSPQVEAGVSRAASEAARQENTRRAAAPANPTPKQTSQQPSPTPPGQIQTEPTPKRWVVGQDYFEHTLSIEPSEWGAVYQYLTRASGRGDERLEDFRRFVSYEEFKRDILPKYGAGTYRLQLSSKLKHISSAYTLLTLAPQQPGAPASVAATSVSQPSVAAASVEKGNGKDHQAPADFVPASTVLRSLDVLAEAYKKGGGAGGNLTEIVSLLEKFGVTAGGGKADLLQYLPLLEKFLARPDPFDQLKKLKEAGLIGNQNAGGDIVSQFTGFLDLQDRLSERIGAKETNPAPASSGGWFGDFMQSYGKYLVPVLVPPLAAALSKYAGVPMSAAPPVAAQAPNPQQAPAQLNGEPTADDYNREMYEVVSMLQGAIENEDFAPEYYAAHIERVYEFIYEGLRRFESREAIIAELQSDPKGASLLATEAGAQFINEVIDLIRAE